jgi:hypothetical protein
MDIPDGLSFHPNGHACSQAQKQMKMNLLMPHAYFHPNIHAARRRKTG